MPVVLIIAGILAFIGVIIWLNIHMTKKRREAMSVVSAELGMEFAPDGDDALLGRLQVFDLFNRGHSRKMRNAMTTQAEIAAMGIFDYHYTTGHGRNAHHHQLSVVSMESESLSIPAFSMRPEGFFDKIGSAFGAQDIDFPDHPLFSKAFVLKGDDEDAVRGFFDREMLDTFAQRQGVSVECRPGIFIYCRNRLKPEQIQGFMEEAVTVFSAFLDRQERAG